MDKSTEVFENDLKKIKNEKELQDFINDLNAKTPGDYLYELMNEKNISPKDIAEIATNVTKDYIYKVRNGQRELSRETCIIICYGAGFTLEETNTLLKYAGFNKLYAKDKTDAIIIYGLENKISVYDMEELLIARGSKLRLMRED